MNNMAVIKAKIKYKGIKLCDVAADAGISVKELVRYLLNRERMPADVFLLICSNLGLTLDDFISKGRNGNKRITKGGAWGEN